MGVELSGLLDPPADDVRAVLHPPCARTSPIERELFLSTFGISRGLHAGKPAWHLLGCGHVVALGEDACMELLSRPPQSLRSAMKRREPKAGIPWTVGSEAESPLLLEAYRPTLDVERSLQCRNCKPNFPINGPRHSWESMRGESEATEILGVKAELRVNLNCVSWGCLCLRRGWVLKSNRGRWRMRLCVGLLTVSTVGFGYVQ
ncbi:unnamed protein product [Ectocarpus sp. 12 AP-2014]